MKIGIVGDELVAKTWETRLQKHASVREVTIVKKSEHLPKLDACIIIDPNETAFDEAALAIRKGIHSFLISRLPTRKEQIERLYHYSEESGVHLQLAHWSSYSPAFQWIQTKIQQIDFVHIERRLTLQNYQSFDFPFTYLWIDELAFCLKLFKSNVHKVDVGLSGITNSNSTDSHSKKDPLKLPQLQLFLRFDNGGSASISLSTGSSESVHKRVMSNTKYTAEFDVIKNKVILSSLDKHENIYQEVRHFEDEEPADRALALFLKSIQTKSTPEYSIFDSLKLTRIIQQIEEKMLRMY